MPALSQNARLEPSIAGVGDYLALLKPRVMSLVVFTALVGLVIAPVHIHPVIGFTGWWLSNAQDRAMLETLGKLV